MLHIGIGIWLGGSGVGTGGVSYSSIYDELSDAILDELGDPILAPILSFVSILDEASSEILDELSNPILAQAA